MSRSHRISRAPGAGRTDVVGEVDDRAIVAKRGKRLTGTSRALGSSQEGRGNLIDWANGQSVAGEGWVLHWLGCFPRGDYGLGAV